MIKAIIKHTIKDYQNVENPKVREKYGSVSGVVGIITNVFLFAIKIICGVIAGSVSIIADAINNLADAGSSVITLIGFKISGKPADDKHPYGHARMEYITGLIVSFIIIFLGIQLIGTSFNKILNPQSQDFNYITIIILVLSILLKFWQGYFYKYMGNIINSTALKATSSDSINDSISTAAVLVGILITKFFSTNLDGYMGLIVAGFITFSGIKLVFETANPLLGTAPTKELVDQIYAKILSYDGVIGLHDLVVHNYGPQRCFASVHVEVPAKQDIMISHDIIDNIEFDFQKTMNIHLVIHLDPIITDDELTNNYRALAQAVINEISPNISMHDFRAVIGQTHTNILFDVCVPSKFDLNDCKLCELISDGITAKDETCNTIITVDRSYISNTIDSSK